MKITARNSYLAGFLAVLAMMAFGFYLQYVEHEEPCPLCMVQRVIFVLMGIVFLLGAVQAPGRIGRRVYAVVMTLIAALGVAVAGRHIWLQSLPPDQVPACGPGLEYMLETLPLTDVLNKLLHGSGECAEKGWTFLTLGIPHWSLLCYLGLAFLSLLPLMVSARQQQSGS